MEHDDASANLASARFPIALTLAVTLLLVGLLAAPASAQNTTQITLEAREDCPDTTFCFEVVGDLEDVEPGDVLDITLENPAENLQEHNVHVAKASEANVGEEESTPSNRAFASSEDVSPGNETSLSTEIPDNAESIYLWCTIRAHETQGMFVEAELAGVEEEANGSPGPGVLATLAAIAAVGGLARRD